MIDSLFKNSPSKRLLKKRVMPTVKRGSSESGAECIFFRFETVGLKAYKMEYDRDHAHEHQSIAYDWGIAPEPFSKIEIPHQNRFCYFTEIAEECVHLSYDEYDAIRDALAECGLQNTDLADRNCGYVNGELVVIDFGPIGSHAV